jgi:hypothetical protein
MRDRRTTGPGRSEREVVADEDRRRQVEEDKADTKLTWLVMLGLVVFAAVMLVALDFLRANRSSP